MHIHCQHPSETSFLLFKNIDMELWSFDHQHLMHLHSMTLSNPLKHLEMGPNRSHIPLNRIGYIYATRWFEDPTLERKIVLNFHSLLMGPWDGKPNRSDIPLNAGYVYAIMGFEDSALEGKIVLNFHTAHFCVVWWLVRQFFLAEKEKYKLNFLNRMDFNFLHGGLECMILLSHGNENSQRDPLVAKHTRNVDAISLSIP